MQTIHDLLNDIDKEIERVKTIATTLLSEFRTAAMIVDEGEIDNRQKWIEQLKELHQSLREITSTHPSLAIDKIAQQNIERMVAVVQDGY